MYRFSRLAQQKAAYFSGAIHQTKESAVKRAPSWFNCQHKTRSQFRTQRTQAAMPPAPVLVVDFDDTITEGDTIGLLINAAIQAQSRLENSGQEAEDRREALRALKDRLVAEYVEAFQSLVERHLPEHNHRKDTGLNMEHVSGFLDDLNDFEIRMNAKVIETGILAGLQEADIEGVAQQVTVRPHALETIKAALHKGWQVHVLSVNWSAALIRSVLAGIPCGIDREAAADSLTLEAADQPVVVIHANSLEMQLGISTGNIACMVQGPLDKGNILEDVLLDIAAACGDGSVPCVYVGDSVGDLSALLVANFPIVLGDNPMLTHALRTFGCQREALSGTGVSLTENALTPGCVLSADSWQQILEWLFPVEALGGAASPGRASNPAPPTPPAGGSSMQRGVSRTISAGDSGRTPHTPNTARAGAVFVELEASTASTHTLARMHSSKATPRDPNHVLPRTTTPPRVLIVAGSDSGGGAGIQADLRTCMANHTFGSTAITALTCQNSHGVHSVHVAPVDTVAAQMDAVLEDIGANVVKTGMLPTGDVVKKVAEIVEGVRKSGKPLPVVVDPVLVSTCGAALGEGDVVAALKTALLPLATVLTPNVLEAAALLGGRSITTLEDMHAAARDLAALGPEAVLIKGGHLLKPQSSPPPATASAAGPSRLTPVATTPPVASSATQVVDVLYDSITGQCTDLPMPRVDTPNTHGTGCTLASAIAARMAHGAPVVTAVTDAQRYVNTCISESVALKLGTGPQGAMDHGAKLCAPVATMANGLAPGAHAGVVKVDYTLYVVTDSGMNKARGRTTAQAVEAAIKGGATVVQIREKDEDGCCFLERVQDAVRVAEGTGVPIIVNDRVDVALAAGAHGVHVGQADLPCSQVRKMVGDKMIVGVSVSTAAEARKAAEEGADYVGVGAVFSTATKVTSEAIGLPGLQEVVKASPLPAVAIGGINADNVVSVMEQGCAGVAVVSCVFAVDDVEEAVRNLRTCMGLNEATGARQAAES